MRIDPLDNVSNTDRIPKFLNFHGHFMGAQRVTRPQTWRLQQRETPIGSFKILIAVKVP